MHADLAGARVLVVDDNHDAGDSIAVVLQLLGAEVRVMRDGATALAAFDAFAPTVVLLDIGMPDMNGYEVARSIRARPGGAAATLIALTGWGQEDDRRRAREAGFDHHLVKPAELPVLLGLMAQAGKE
jgi:CheY-like chemotaxis protein